ncbi:MAG: SpoIIE family protein phosphatase [bacterium]
MKSLKPKLIISVILFFIAFSLKSGSFSSYGMDFYLGIVQLREIIIFISLLFLYKVVSNIKWFGEISLIRRLQYFGLSLIVTWLWTMISGSSVFFSDFTNKEITYKTIRSFPDLFSIITVFCFLVIVIAMLALLKELIFIQQRKYTERNYKILIFLLFLVMFVSIWIDGTMARQFSSWEVTSVEPLKTILYVLLFLFFFINGLRCKWIHYLNKHQKLLILFIGSILTSLIIITIININPIVQKYGRLIGSSLKFLFLYFGVYTSMSLIGILFQLPSAGIMDRRMKDLKLLKNLSASIGSVLDVDELISKSADLTKDIINADFILMELKKKDKYQLQGWQGIVRKKAEGIPPEFFSQIRNVLADNKDSLFINDFSQDQRVKGITYKGITIGSMLASFIKLKNEELGVLYAFSKNKFAYMEDSIGIFCSVADQVAVALKNLELFNLTLEQQVYKEELRVAHEAQMRLLPQKLVPMEEIEIEGMTSTANEVGGDLYDYYLIGENRLDIVIGDVSGKGAFAAFNMAELKGVIQALAPHLQSPKEIVSETNKFIRNNFKRNMFTTMIYAVYHFNENEFRFVRAGHPPLCYLKTNGIKWLEPEGLGLGLADKEKFNNSLKEERIVLKSGEAVFFHTDGIEEARNKQGEEFGEEILSDILTGCDVIKNSAGEIMEQVFKQVSSFTIGTSVHDDMSMVVLKRKK